MAQFSTIAPVVIYLALSFLAALWARKQSQKTSDSHGFIEEYFIGGRSMGGFVLAMSIIASYTSASSFVGGPGVAYKLGLSWVLLAMIQVPTTFLTLGVLGKRFAIMARKTRSVTLTDFLRARYRSDAVVILCSLALLVFFMAAMLAQFIGGARLFQAVTGYPYIVGLALFGFTVILYTAVGGFRAVVLTDAIQGMVMVFASVVVLVAVVNAGGGMERCVATLKAIDPGLITPTGPGGTVPQPMILSFWVLVGLGILGLPQTSQKCMGYKDSRSMHDAMIMGTLIIGFLLLCVHLAGTLGRAVIPDLPAGDLAMPTLIMELLSPFWAGVFIAGPLAAIMSTVDSMLLLASAAIIKDLYIHYGLKGDASRMTPARLQTMSLACTAVIGLIVFASAIEPPDLLVWINLFAFGGLEAVFLWPIILGLYWKEANASGAVASIVAGVACFFALSILKPGMGGIHAIVPTSIAAFAAFVIGAKCGRPASDDVIRLFWGEGDGSKRERMTLLGGNVFGKKRGMQGAPYLSPSFPSKSSPPFPMAFPSTAFPNGSVIVCGCFISAAR